VLILAVSEDLDELLEDSCLATITPLCELSRIVIEAIYLAAILVVAIVCGKDDRTD